MTNTLYKDLYSSDFLENFGEYEEIISSIKLTDDCIDVNKIAEKCNISIEYGAVDYSGKSINDVKKKIIINSLETVNNMRFTIAHEIGHIILGHIGESYKHFDSEEYKEVFQRINEFAANNFAAELIMPEKLITKVFDKVADRLGYEINDINDDYDILKIINEVSKIMKVPKEVLYARSKSLGVF